MSYGNQNSKKYIYNSYNSGDIAATVRRVGGIIGYSQCTNVYYCVNTTNEIKNGGSIIGGACGSNYTYDKADSCYYDKNLKAVYSGRNTVANSITFTDEIDKNIMLETLNTNLGTIEWNANTTNIWKNTTDNNEYPILYWE